MSTLGDKISRGFDFVIGPNFTCGIYSISHLKGLGRFMKIQKKYIFTFKSIFAIQVCITTKLMCSYLLQLNHIQICFRYLFPLSLSIILSAIDIDNFIVIRWFQKCFSCLSVSSALLFWRGYKSAKGCKIV